MCYLVVTTIRSVLLTALLFFFLKLAISGTLFLTRLVCRQIVVREVILIIVGNVLTQISDHWYSFSVSVHCPDYHPFDIWLILDALYYLPTMVFCLSLESSIKPIFSDSINSTEILHACYTC